MATYEVAVDASFDLAPRRRDWKLGDPREPVEVWFQRRKFTWHPGDEETYAVVTTAIADPSDYEAERLATERFLSALTYDSLAATVLFESATGFERDTPVIKQPRRPAHLHRVAPELVVGNSDPDLAKCLALFVRPTHRAATHTSS